MQRGRIRSIAALFALWGWPALVPAQTEPPLHRPEVRPGDHWVYQRVDYADQGKILGRRNLTVVRANDRIIQVVRTTPHGEIDETYTSEWNAVATSGAVFDPYEGLLLFPMQVGDRYPVDYEKIAGAERERRVRYRETATVTGWEQVTVPAGTFRALKVRIEGSFERIDKNVAGTAKSEVWYVPEVKRWVKNVYSDARGFGGRRGDNNHIGEELLRFELR